jgi:hypothetical protein
MTVLSVENMVFCTHKESKTRPVKHEEHVGVFYLDCGGIVHKKFVPPCQMVNQHYYWVA